MIKMEKRNQTYPKAKIVEEIVRFFKNDTISFFFHFQNLSFEKNIFCIEEFMFSG
jgi:ribosomal protein L10